MMLLPLLKIIDKGTNVTISKRLSGHDILLYTGLALSVPFGFDNCRVQSVWVDPDWNLRIQVKGFVPYALRPSEPMVDFEVLFPSSGN